MHPLPPVWRVSRECMSVRSPALARGASTLRIRESRESQHVYLSPMFAQRYRLMPAAPVAPDVVAALFEALATRIQRRGRCHRVTALQRALDEKPDRFPCYYAAHSGASKRVHPDPATTARPAQPLARSAHGRQAIGARQAFLGTRGTRWVAWSLE